MFASGEVGSDGLSTRCPVLEISLGVRNRDQAAVNAVASSRSGAWVSGSGRVAWTLPGTTCPSTLMLTFPPTVTFARSIGTSTRRLEISARSATLAPLGEKLSRAHRHREQPAGEGGTQGAPFELEVRELRPRLGRVDLRLRDRRVRRALGHGLGFLDVRLAILSRARASARSSWPISCRSRTTEPTGRSKLRRMPSTGALIVT